MVKITGMMDIDWKTYTLKFFISTSKGEFIGCVVLLVAKPVDTWLPRFQPFSCTGLTKPESATILYDNKTFISKSALCKEYQ